MVSYLDNIKILSDDDVICCLKIDGMLIDSVNQNIYHIIIFIKFHAANFWFLSTEIILKRKISPFPEASAYAPPSTP